MNYCVDCKHFAVVRLTDYLCCHPQLLHPVGKTPLECFMVRGGNDGTAVFNYGKCGEEGKFFEPKNDVT